MSARKCTREVQAGESACISSLHYQDAQGIQAPGLGPPGCPFTVSFLVGRVPLQNRLQNKGCPYSNLSTGLDVGVNFSRGQFSGDSCPPSTFDGCMGRLFFEGTFYLGCCTRRSQGTPVCRVMPGPPFCDKPIPELWHAARN